MKLEKHIDINSKNAQSTAVDTLKYSTSLTKAEIKQVMAKGAVWLTRNNSTQRIRRASKQLQEGDCLHLYYDADVLASVPNDATLISDEGAYSIWFKPYGMLSQGAKWGDHCTINRWVEANLQPQRPAFIVHRLDRAATGLMVIAHQKKVAANLSMLFQNRQIKKHYQAIIHGQLLEEKTMDSPIDGKPSISHIKPLEYNPVDKQTLVEVNIETGRKHQIRKHLSEAGFPIVGDRLYGLKGAGNERDLCLTSCFLSFLSPLDNLKKEYRLPDLFKPNFE